MKFLLKKIQSFIGRKQLDMRLQKTSKMDLTMYRGHKVNEVILLRTDYLE